MLQLVLLSAALGLASLSPRSQSCQSHEQLIPFRPAPDYVVVKGATVARTRAVLRTLFPTPQNLLHAYPGERISIYLGDKPIGYAVYDACQLLPEWPDTIKLPDLNSITAFQMYEGRNVPQPYRNARGYRVLRITKWGGHVAPRR